MTRSGSTALECKPGLHALPPVASIRSLHDSASFDLSDLPPLKINNLGPAIQLQFDPRSMSTRERFSHNADRALMSTHADSHLVPSPKTHLPVEKMSDNREDEHNR